MSEAVTSFSGNRRRLMGILGAIGIAAFVAGVAVGATGCGLGLKDGASENYGNCQGANCGCMGGNCGPNGPGAKSYHDVILETPDLIRYWNLDEPSGTLLHNTTPDGLVDNLSTTGTENTNYFLAVPGVRTSPGAYFPLMGIYASGGSLNLGVLAQFTLETWVNFQTCASGVPIFVGTGSPHEGLYCGATAGRVQMRVESGSIAAAEANLRIDDQHWHHLVGTWNRSSTTAELFIDGRLRMSASAAVGAFSTAGTMISSATVGPVLFDEVAIYSRHLSSDEILRHYQAGAFGIAQ